MKSPIATIVALTSALVLTATAADDPALVEFIPDGVTPDPAQRAIVAACAAEVYLCKVGYDADGNVRSLQLSNHNAFMPPGVEDKESHTAGREGVSDATFAKLEGLPELKALRLLKQPLADESFAVLSSWPDLEAFCVERNDWDDHDNASADFMLHLNGLKNLRWLELKHLFGLNETRVDQLEGFPRLERIELDNASAQEECIAFLEKCPNIRDFELHRTNMGNEGIEKIVAALPKLERFDVKQHAAKDLDARCLEAVATLPNLQTFVINRWKDDQLFWEEGVEHLLNAPSLRHLGDKKAVQHPAVRRLLEESSTIEPAQGRHYAVEFDYQAF